MINENYEEKVRALYDELVPNGTPYDEVVKEIKKQSGRPEFPELCKVVLEDIVSEYATNDLFYPNRLNATALEMRRYVIDLASLLPDEYNYYRSLAAFFRGDYIESSKRIKAHIIDAYVEDSFNEEDLGGYIVDFKNAYKGFWIHFAEALMDRVENQSIIDLCYLLDDFYWGGDIEHSLNVMLAFMSNHQQMILPKEIVAMLYYKKKMWNNALSYYEQIEEKELLSGTILFEMAWAYGKIKDLENEELYYRKYIEAEPEDFIAVNNLGYCLYRQKRYDEALTLYKKCLDQGDFENYVPNNYVSALVSLGRLEEARQVVESGEYTIWADTRNRLERAEKKMPILESSDEEEQGELEESVVAEEEGYFEQSQFSSEKILEDELTSRIESGSPVFGLNLKIWRRHGEYGRQYILPNNKRLDLLCEDENGNIVIIELKKDSGYSDAYSQLIEYIDSLGKLDQFKGKEISGIICLNSPSDDLLERAHQDKRVRVFEYQVTYVER